MTVLADRLLASQEFKSLTQQIASGNAETAAKRARLEKLIARSEIFDKWYKALTIEQQKQIGRAGFINWLSGTSED